MPGCKVGPYRLPRFLSEFASEFASDSSQTQGHSSQSCQTSTKHPLVVPGHFRKPALLTSNFCGAPGKPPGVILYARIMHASGPGKYFASFFAPIYFCQIGCLIFCLSAQKTVICVAQTSSLTHPPQTLPTRGPAPSHALLQVSYATRQKQRPGTPPHGPGSEPENSRGNMEKQRPMLVFLLARPPQIGKVQSLKNRGFLLCTELSALPC